MQKVLTISAFILSVILFSCTKEGAGYGDETYYGNIDISQVALSDATELDVYIDGKKEGTIGTASYFNRMLTANSNAEFAIYKAGTKTLVADTVINILKNSSASFKVIYSESIGAKGIINPEGCGTDSAKIQFINSLNTTMYPYPELDVYVLRYKGSVFYDTTVVKGVKQGEMMKHPVTLSRYRDGVSVAFVYMLKDPKTGNFIGHKSAPATKLFALMPTNTGYNGLLTLAQISDNGGDETTNRIANIKLTVITN